MSRVWVPGLADLAKQTSVQPVLLSRILREPPQTLDALSLFFAGFNKCQGVHVNSALQL